MAREFESKEQALRVLRMGNQALKGAADRGAGYAFAATTGVYRDAAEYLGKQKNLTTRERQELDAAHKFLGVRQATGIVGAAGAIGGGPFAAGVGGGLVRGATAVTAASGAVGSLATEDEDAAPGGGAATTGSDRPDLNPAQQDAQRSDGYGGTDAAPISPDIIEGAMAGDQASLEALQRAVGIEQGTAAPGQPEVIVGYRRGQEPYRDPMRGGFVEGMGGGVTSGLDRQPLEAVLNVPTTWDREKTIEMQEKLYAGGFFNYTKEFDEIAWGNPFDGDTLRAWERLAQVSAMSVAAGSTATMEQILDKAIGANEELGGVDAIAARAEPTDVIRLTNPQDLSHTIKQVAKAALGRNPKPEEQRAFVALAHSLQRQAGQAMAAIPDRGGGVQETVDSPDIGVAAQQFLEEQNPVESGAREAVRVYNDLLGLIGAGGGA